MATSASDLRAAKSLLSRRYLGKASPPTITTFALAAPLAPAQNVVGVGIGSKFVEGQETATQCVRFYVDQKIPKNALSAAEMLPPAVDGVPTDVIVTGRFRLFTTAADNKKRRRPVRPGLSIGFAFPPPKDGFVMAGTFGAVVERNGKRYILSNKMCIRDST